ncbi:MAG: hypothetical protein DRH03_12055 [Deltaproteobacteria bacterium]|nr:MAG: hypothetical protein DRH03_12055 [Deltaproteobacteria bacterium]
MKYSLLTVMLLASASSLMAQESIQVGNVSQDHTYENLVDKKGINLGNDWYVKIDLRTGWLQYDYGNAPTGGTHSGDPTISKGHTDSKGFYVIPKVSLITPSFGGFAAKVTGMYTTDLGFNDPNYETRTFVPNPQDPKAFAILQEAYIRFDNNGNKVLVGRQELTTPMIDADDWYMQANAFEVAHYTNSMIEDNMFSLGFFHKMAGVWDSGAYDATIAPLGGTDFYSMSQASFVGSADKANVDPDAGVLFGAYEYHHSQHNVQAWEYYATDLYNMLFLQYDFKDSVGGFSYVIGAQFIDWQEVGAYEKTSNAAGNGARIDYSLYSARFDGSFDFGLNFATGVAKYTDGKGQGDTLGAWGGYPYFANGMIFHFFEAGSLQNAASYKAQIGYDIMDNLWVGYRYTFFGLDSSNSFAKMTDPGDPTKTIDDPSKGQDAMHLNGIRLSYGGKQGAYFTGTYESVKLDHEPDTYSLRLIGGIKF